MIAGVDGMAKHGIIGTPLALVAAHGLESVLKAYLSRNGDDSRLMERKVRHDLEKLWQLAVAEGLPVGVVPDWAANLSQIHKHPYYLRYSAGIHGIITPAPQPMATELREILSKVRQCIADYRRTSSET